MAENPWSPHFATVFTTRWYKATTRINGITESIKTSEMFSYTTLFATATIGLASAARWMESDIQPNTGSSQQVFGQVRAVQKAAEEILTLEVHLQGLQPNSRHGWHIHQLQVVNGNCSTAGGHYNPTNMTHGDPDSGGPRHVGDLGNFQVGDDGSAVFQYNETVASLYGPNAILTQSIVIHELADDFTGASGNAGGRLACGNIVVKEISAPTGGPRIPATCMGDMITCVVEGDNLFNISQEYGLDLKKVIANNPHLGPDFDLIYPGDQVCIPPVCRPMRTPSKCDGELLKRVKSGDTLYKLAVANNFDLDTLIAANPQLGPNYDLIFPLDEVCVPAGCPPYKGPGSAPEPVFEVVVYYDEKGGRSGTTSKVDGGYDSGIAGLSSSSSALASSIALVMATSMVFI